MIAWLIVERSRSGHATTLGAASGAVAGLVAVTRARASSAAWRRSRSEASPARVLLRDQPEVPLRIRRRARRHCRASRRRDHRFDTARAVRRRSVNPAGTDGVFFGGGWGLFGEQVLAVASVFAFSFVVSGLIALLLRAVLPRRDSCFRRRGAVRASISPSIPRPATPSSGSEKERRHEAHRRNRQAVQAERREGSAAWARGARSDGFRGAGLRASARPYRGVPGRRVHGRLRAEGARRDPRGRRRSATRRRRPDGCHAYRQDRRREGLGDPDRRRPFGSEPGKPGSDAL